MTSLSLPKLVSIKTDDTDLSRVVESLKTIFNSFYQREILAGQRLTSIALKSASNPTKVPHKLGRAALGYFTTKKSANSQIWDTAIDANFISLNCSADVTIDLWVF